MIRKERGHGGYWKHMVADRGAGGCFALLMSYRTVLMPWIPVYAYICKKLEVSGRSHY